MQCTSDPWKILGYKTSENFAALMDSLEKKKKKTKTKKKAKWLVSTLSILLDQFENFKVLDNLF